MDALVLVPVLDRELVLDHRESLAELTHVQLRGVDVTCPGLKGLTKRIAYLAAEVTGKAGEDQDGLIAMIQFSVADHAVVIEVVVELASSVPHLLRQVMRPSSFALLPHWLEVVVGVRSSKTYRRFNLCWCPK